MKSIIFYSWQSDLPNSTNRGFIQTALERAAKEIRGDDSISVEPVVERDTANVAGAPDIAATIFQKIEACDVFVCDISIISPKSRKRKTPNPNVLIELGYAARHLGWNRIVLVFNTAYGKMESLPFDLKMKRVLTYHQTENIEKATERGKLQRALCEAFRLVYEGHKNSNVKKQDSIDIPTEKDEAWLEQTRRKAQGFYSEAGFNAYAETWAFLTFPRVDKSSPELMTAVDSSQLRKSDWSIGIMDRSVHSMMPKADRYGIIFSYVMQSPRICTYWALTHDGAFYMLESLFEDIRYTDQFHFDTRTERIVETLLFLSKLYTKLDAPEDASIYLKFRWAGLQGRFLLPFRKGDFGFGLRGSRKNEMEDTHETGDGFAVKLSSLNMEKDFKEFNEIVYQLVAPLFHLFSLFEIRREDHDKIVTDYIKSIA